MKKIYIDWTDMGPGAESGDADDFVAYIKKHMPDACVIIGAGPTDDDTRHEVNELFNQYLVSTAARAMGRKGGTVKSEAKTKAARENAKKGGRPRKMNIREKLNMEWAENGGKAPSWGAVVNMMEDDIRERVHADLTPCTEAEFFAGYEDWDGGKLGDITQW
jgi:hypothetical protein